MTTRDDSRFHGLSGAATSHSTSHVALLAALHQGAGAAYYWQAPGTSTWFRAGEARALPAARDVYFGVNLAARPAGRHSRGTVAALGCLYAEFDAKDFAGGKAEALAHVQELTPPPSAVVDSGGGFHVYWLLAERWELTSDAERERARGLQARWVDRTGGDRGAKDIARVLRVPGTWNTKYDPPRPVELLAIDEGLRYTVAELEALAPAPPPAPPRPVRSAARPLGGRGSVIAQFNDAHTARDLVERYGGTVAGALVRCNCGVQHTNDTQGMLTSEGNLVIYSDRCRWAACGLETTQGVIVKPFDLFVAVEHAGDVKAAAAALRPARGPRPPEERPEADAAAHRAREAARKREARRAEASATLQSVHDRAAQDEVLARRPAERAILHALLDIAGDRDWCRPSKARLVEMTGYSLGAVKRALHELEQRGYLRSEGDGGGPNDTAIRTFLRGSGVIHESIESMSLEHAHAAGEGGAAFTPVDDPLSAALSADAPPPVPADKAARRRRLRDFASPDWHHEQLRELDRMRAEQGQGSPENLKKPEIQEPIAPAPVERGAPADPTARQKYFALLGRARKATTGRQRRYLEALAAALEEWHPASRPAPPSPAPRAAQLELVPWATETSARASPALCAD